MDLDIGGINYKTRTSWSRCSHLKSHVAVMGGVSSKTDNKHLFPWTHEDLARNEFKRYFMVNWVLYGRLVVHKYIAEPHGDFTALWKLMLSNRMPRLKLVVSQGSYKKLKMVWCFNHLWVVMWMTLFFVCKFWNKIISAAMHICFFMTCILPHIADSLSRLTKTSSKNDNKKKNST